jgi:hypothetical protein
MVKTKGSIDRVRHRKRRSDFKKKRNIYAGKKTKPRHKVNGNFVPYVSTRRRGDLIKIWFWSVEPMSHGGIMNFAPKVRRHIHKIVYGRHKLRMDVEPEIISTKENIEELCLDHLWVGEWMMMMWSSSKNRFHVSAKAVAKIKITQHPNGMTCKVYPSWKKRSLRRYWFWRDS